MTELEALGILVPAHRDGPAAKSLVAALLVAADRCPVPVSIVVADNGGNDGFGGGLPDDARLRTVEVAQRGPGRARTAAARTLVEDWRERGNRLESAWIVSLDADTAVDPDFLIAWTRAIDGSSADVLNGPLFFGPLGGDHALPEDVDAAAAWLWSLTALCETFVGIVNSGGCNHALRASVSEANEYYVQPVASVDGTEVIVPGSDWDFGLRARLQGIRVARVASPICVTSVRRIGHDPAGFLAGRSYEKPFEPVAAGDVATAWPPPEDWASIADNGRARIIAHFLLKPIVADLSAAPSLRWFLGETLWSELNAMSRMARPAPGQWQTYRTKLIGRLFEPETFDLARRIGRRLAGVAA
jgi:hypothetical protein